MIHTDKREKKKNYEFAGTLSFMFNQFSNGFLILVETYFYDGITFK